jgi:hypothetical protein
VPGGCRALAIVYATTDVLLDECVVDASNAKSKFVSARPAAFSKGSADRYSSAACRAISRARTGISFGNCLRHVTSVRRSARYTRGTLARRLMLRHSRARGSQLRTNLKITHKEAATKSSPRFSRITATDAGYTVADRTNVRVWRSARRFRAFAPASISVSVRPGQPHGS